mmetsp:Transcript_60431/g.128088  ORF Transcript_60431/g.128088 Transcript_60431/m.128088 type:complete len:619 (+) Transcript_60431:25-1881(+)
MVLPPVQAKLGSGAASGEAADADYKVKWREAASVRVPASDEDDLGDEYPYEISGKKLPCRSSWLRRTAPDPSEETIFGGIGSYHSSGATDESPSSPFSAAFAIATEGGPDSAATLSAVKAAAPSAFGLGGMSGSGRGAGECSEDRSNSTLLITESALVNEPSPGRPNIIYKDVPALGGDPGVALMRIPADHCCLAWQSASIAVEVVLGIASLRFTPLSLQADYTGPSELALVPTIVVQRLASTGLLLRQTSFEDVELHFDTSGLTSKVESNIKLALNKVAASLFAPCLPSVGCWKFPFSMECYASSPVVHTAASWASVVASSASAGTDAFPGMARTASSPSSSSFSTASPCVSPSPNSNSNSKKFSSARMAATASGQKAAPGRLHSSQLQQPLLLALRFCDLRWHSYGVELLLWESEARKECLSALTIARCATVLHVPGACVVVVKERGLHYLVFPDPFVAAGWAGLLRFAAGHYAAAWEGEMLAQCFGECFKRQAQETHAATRRWFESAAAFRQPKVALLAEAEAADCLDSSNPDAFLLRQSCGLGAELEGFDVAAVLACPPSKLPPSSETCEVDLDGFPTHSYRYPPAEVQHGGEEEDLCESKPTRSAREATLLIW